MPMSTFAERHAAIARAREGMKGHESRRHLRGERAPAVVGRLAIERQRTGRLEQRRLAGAVFTDDRDQTGRERGEIHRCLDIAAE